MQAALIERLRVLERDNSNLTREGELVRHQYERCLDDVANQVVKALLAQKVTHGNVRGLFNKGVALDSMVERFIMGTLQLL